MPRVTLENLKHLSLLVRLGANPAATVYESLGEDFFIAPPDGWLNLGLWEPGQRDASKASEHLVATLATSLPKKSVVIDVGNGLGAQDAVIKEVTEALSLSSATERRGSPGPGPPRWPPMRPGSPCGTRAPTASSASKPLSTSPRARPSSPRPGGSCGRAEF